MREGATSCEESVGLAWSGLGEGFGVQRPEKNEATSLEKGPPESQAAPSLRNQEAEGLTP